MVWYESKNGWRTELRYNYEDSKTASLHFGKSLKQEGKLTYEFTPAVGVLFGQSNGVSADVKMNLEYKSFFFSTEPQYFFSSAGRENSFFYSWTELGMAPVSFFYTGIALQHTKLYANNNGWEPGVFAGFEIKNFSLPVYCFNPFSADRYFVIGLQWQWKN